MCAKQVVAMGGGGFSMEGTPLMDDYLLGLVDRPLPRICFLATASGDSDAYTVRFYNFFNKRECKASHLSLFRADGRDLTDFLCNQDIVYVGGGSTVNMLAIWKLHGMDEALRKAYEQGTIMTGLSAGSICWFEQGTTDSFGGELAPLDCLGFVSGSHSPHYDGEAERRPAYHRMISEGSISPGYAADDSAALHFIDGRLAKCVSSQPNANCYHVTRNDAGEAVETTLETIYLGD